MIRPTILILYRQNKTIQKSHLTFHRVSVDLAHVGAGVVRLDVAHVQFPGVMVVVGDREPGV